MEEERGMFVRVEIDQGCTSLADGCRVCVTLCPVDIFDGASGEIRVVGANEDECILCNLCVERCPASVVRIRKLYGREAVEGKGAAQV